MKKTLIAAALATTLLAGGAALARQEAPGPMRDPLTRVDADKDGVVTKAELLADVDAHFARIDANHDGKISAEEREAAFAARRAKMAERRGPGRGPMGMRADADGDGVVTLDEQRAQALKRFGFVDTNGDGKIDQAERDAVRDRMAMRGRGHHRGPPPPPGEGPPPPPPADAPDGPDGQ